MRIPNKFNGYSADNIRLYNDPVSAGVILAPEVLGGTVASAGALEGGIAAGMSLAGGSLGSMAGGALGSMMGGAAAPAAAQLAGTVAPELAQAVAAPALETAASQAGLQNLTPVNQLAQGAPFANPAITQTGLGTGPIVPPVSAPVVPPVDQVAQAAATDVAKTPGLTDAIRNAQATEFGAPQISYAPGEQGIAANAPATAPKVSGSWYQDAKNLIKDPSWSAAKQYAEDHPYATAGAAGLAGMGIYNMFKSPLKPPGQDKGMIRPYTLNRNLAAPGSSAYSGSTPYSNDSSERQYFNDVYTAQTPYKAAEGGLMNFAVGGPVETMSAQNAVGQNQSYPQAGLQTSMYSNPMVQRPVATNVIDQGVDTNVDPYTGEEKLAAGGMANLGGYSDGGRLLRGPGDGVSDSIPASIGDRQPARLADGEFVVPARIVSEIGNGSTEAGARKLYAMMERVQGARKKSIGKGNVAVNSKADNLLPA